MLQMTGQGGMIGFNLGLMDQQGIGRLNSPVAAQAPIAPAAVTVGMPAMIPVGAVPVAEAMPLQQGKEYPSAPSVPHTQY